MTATVRDVRLKLRDTVEPYTYSDKEIAGAMADAIDWIMIQSVPETCPKYDLLHKLVTCRYLVSSKGINGAVTGPVSQITEGNRSLTYAVAGDQSTAIIGSLTTDIDDLVAYCKGREAGQVRGGAGVFHDNF